MVVRSNHPKHASKPQAKRLELRTAFDLEFRPNSFRPILWRSVGAPARFHKNRWPQLEQALDKSLDARQRRGLEEAVFLFLFSVLHEKALPHPDQYLSQLGVAIDGALASLAEFLSAGTIMPVKHRIGPVLSARDHVAAIIQSDWTVETNSAAKLFYGLLNLEEQLSAKKRRRVGSTGDYQLEALFANIVLIAKNAGSNLRLNSHEDRYSDEVRYTPLVRFTKAVFDVVAEDTAILMLRSGSSAADRKQAASRVRKLLKKNTGNLIAPLERARRLLEGKSRAKKAPPK